MRRRVLLRAPRGARSHARTMSWHGICLLSPTRSSSVMPASWAQIAADRPTGAAGAELGGEAGPSWAKQGPCQDRSRRSQEQGGAGPRLRLDWASFGAGSGLPFGLPYGQWSGAGRIWRPRLHMSLSRRLFPGRSPVRNTRALSCAFSRPSPGVACLPGRRPGCLGATRGAGGSVLYCTVPRKSLTSFCSNRVSLQINDLPGGIGTGLV